MVKINPNIPERDIDRDKALIDAYGSKGEDGAWQFRVGTIAYKFDISTTRLYQILDTYKIIRRSIR